MENFQITPEFLRSIITLVLIVIIVVFLFKKFLKAAIAIGVILVLFNIGFLANGTELRSSLNMDDWMSSENADSVEAFFNDFSDKREEYGVVDAQAIYDDAVEGIKQGTTILIDGLGYLDIPAFAESVANKLVELGTNTIDWDQLEAQIKEQLGNISQADLDKVMNQIRDDLSKSEVATNETTS